MWSVVALAVVSSLAWLTMRVVAASPAFSDSGASTMSEVALLCTVVLLASVGIVHRLARPANPFGWLLILVASLELATEWDIPGATAAGSLSAAVFSAGLLLTIAVPITATWAVFAFPSGRVDGRVERYLVVAGALVFIGALGLAPALAFDPQAEGCSDCPANLLLGRDNPDLAATTSRLGMTAALAWTAVAIVVSVVRLARMSPASRRSRGAAWTIGLAYLVAVLAQLVLSLDRGFVGGSTTERGPWWAQLACLAALAVAVALSLLRSRAMRRSVTGLVVGLHREVAAGGMREALSSSLQDPTLQVAYAVDGTYRDVDLAPVDVGARPGRATSRLVDDGEEIAVLVHRPGLLDHPDAVQEVVTAARLGLENERLRAEALAQVRALAESRIRTIEAGDRERRRLERDLHDGAQQRLVGLLLGLRLLRSTLSRDQPEVERTVDEAEAEIADTVRDLRELATGLFPNVLVTEGLAGALQALSETVPLRVGDAPGGRLPPAVETTAYLVIATAAARGPTTVRAAYDEGSLRVCAEVASANVGFAGLDDRVAAIGGHLAVRRVDGGSRVDLELPLALGASPQAEPTYGARN
jgi:signal transduction histidine kinase